MPDVESLARLAPIPQLMNYPVLTSLCAEVVLVGALLVLAKWFDPSRGSLTIALLIVTSFIGLVVFVSMFSVAPDEETAMVVGGLATAFGAVVAFWLRAPP